MAVFVADKIGIEPHGADRQNQPGAAGQPNGIYRGQEQEPDRASGTGKR